MGFSGCRMEELTNQTEKLALAEGNTQANDVAEETATKNNQPVKIKQADLEQYNHLLAQIDIPKATLPDEAILALKMGYGCVHSPGEACPPCHQAFYEWLKNLYLTFKKQLGLEHELTLNSLIDCAYEYIKAYQLTLCDQLLMEGYDTCKARGTDDSFYIKMIQALAFLRFKQSRFQDAVDLFEEMRVLLGPNPSLLENTGHAYNSIGDQENAQRCFTEALELCSLDPSHKAHKGGLLLGLGLVKTRRGNLEGGLAELKEALQWYIDDLAGQDNALIAKAHVSVAGTLEQMDRHEEAEPHYKEAIRIFKATCGEVNPLTADALRKMGLCLREQQKWEEAYDTLSESLVSNVGIDTFAINLANIAEIMITLMQIQEELPHTAEQEKMFIGLVRHALLRLLQANPEITSNPNFNFLFQLCIRDIPPEEIAAISAKAEQQDSE